MTHSEQLNELFEALSQFQSEVTTVPFDAKVKVRTKQGGSYEFEYATLGACINASKDKLSEVGLSVTQLLDDGGIKTIIGHKSGQFISGTFDMPIKDSMGPQDIGGVITYFRRYAYSAALRLNSEKDDDANGASGNEAQFQNADLPFKEKKSPKSTPKKSKEKPKEASSHEESGDIVIDEINKFTDDKELVLWYNNQTKQAKDKSSFNEKYFPEVRRRIEEIKS